MALTAAAVKQAQPKDKKYILKDDHGLYLEVSPSGGKWWRVRYWFQSRENRLSLGTYPVITLAEAREKCLEIKRQIAAGIDPSQERKEKKQAKQVEESSSFKAVAETWLSKKTGQWTENHATTVRQRLEANVYPYLGDTQIKAITAPMMLDVLRRIEARGALEVARRVRGICSLIFRFAIACGLDDQDPAAPLVGALLPPPKKHYASIINPTRVAQLLIDIDNYSGSHIVRCAMKLTPLVFVRPGELRKAEWSEFDLEAAEWRIPDKRMKMRIPHIVPLSRQALAILNEVKLSTGKGKYVFPAMTSSQRPMSENTVNTALRRMGYPKEEMTAHGFRSMASTLLNEQGWKGDAIERQLGHNEKNKVRAAYNYAEYFPERREMMQAWADYLDDLRQSSVK